ncbi:MAG: leucine-rich repeat domain-containing protein, partial [Oscillospiraceae bacterium]|nr:leucine-rich repeat domain-containing protein [Oscillospiraceae bacterium]
MKKAVSLILSILMVFALLPVASFSSLAAEGDEAIIFGDDNLRLKLCNSGIDTNEDGEISYNEILALNGIFVDPSTQITSLEGLQYAKNLQNLDITSQSISDWEPVAQLNKLVFVSLVNTNFSDILLIDSPELTNLSIIGSLVTEIPQEFNCNKLTYLTIRECELTDISGVANLTNLWHIYIRDTALSDISPLAALSAILVPQLTNFDLRDNQIEDISPLEGFKSLDNLILSNNKISTISKLPAFKYNGSLSLSNNEIEDLSVFEQFAGFWIGAQFINTKQTFDILYLDGNRISDITPLENIRAANSLKLDNNDITDISPILELAYCNQLDVSMNWLDVEEGSAAKSDIDTIKSKGTNLTYTPQKDFLTLTDAATGITVMEKDPHSIPAGAELSITEVTEGETFTLASLALESLARVFKLYDISLSLEGEEVQPSGKIRVTLPVPEGYVLSTASVYYINAFGKPSQVPSVLKNGSLVFELEHLSLYAVVDAIEDDSDTIIDFPDANLKAALIAEGVDANGDGEISRGEMAGVETLDLYGSAISNIEGLQYAVNLTELDLGSNQISNISPLANLTSLTVLSLSGNQISDLSPLANLTNLTQLDLTYNNLIDISPLANLTRLSELYLSFTQTSDISPISNLTGLTSLSLGNNKIIDISPLANLTSLDFIYLSYNPISDISPLANLTNLTELYLSGNQISSISP